MPHRAPAPLCGLTMGLKCGGSDGFTGISANPAIGYISDLLVTLGGKTVLSEFPELTAWSRNWSTGAPLDELRRAIRRPDAGLRCSRAGRCAPASR